MSLQTRNYAKITEVPLKDIRRPIMPVLDGSKIDAMVSTLQGTPTASATCSVEDAVAGELPPIDVLCVSHKGQRMYFAFGGCHRFQAYERSGTQMVRCKVLPCTRDMLKVYLGASVDTFFKD